jgi:hypothetical protein
LWATQKLLPLVSGGEFARRLEGSRKAALELFARLERDPRVRTALAPELDIVVWAPDARSASEMSALSRGVFEDAARANLHLAVANLPRALLEPWWPNVSWDRDQVTVVRSCLIKPEHELWLDRIWSALERVLPR